MAANCVTKQQKRSPEYIGAMDKLDISSSVLELLLFEYQSLPENEEAFSKGELPFPSIEYLQGQLYAPAITVLDGSIIEYYDKHLNDKTFTAKTLQEAKNISHVIGKRIGHDSVRVVETKNGQYKVLTTRPKLDNSVEIEKILSKAPRDEQGRLLAPNGKPSNLTERQYAQVRTKAFIDWFGNWINNPENASKVVDENGEPMVVYHGGSLVDIFDTSGKSGRGAGIKKGDTGAYFTNILHSAKWYEEIHSYKNSDAVSDIIDSLKEQGLSEEEITNEWNTSLLSLRSGTRHFFLNIKNPKFTHYTLNNDGVYNQEDKNVNENDGLIITRSDTQELEFVAYNPNQIKSATDNIGTFSNTDNNIYHHRSHIQQAFNIIEQSKKEAIQTKTEEELKIVIAKTNKQLSEIISPNIQVAGGYYGLRKLKTEKLKLLDTLADLEKPSDSKELNILFETLSKKFNRKFNIHKVSLSEIKRRRGNNVSCFIEQNGNEYDVWVDKDNYPSYTMLAEEMLHPLIQEIQYRNPELFQQFLDECLNTKDKTIKTLVDSIIRAYPTKEQVDENYNGETFSLAVLNNEIVTQVLAYKLKHIEQKQSSTFKQIIAKIVEWLNNKGLFTGKRLNFNLHTFAYCLKFENVKFDLTLQLEEQGFNHITTWARTSENNYEVSSQGDKRFSALYATFKESTIIDGEDVGGKTIEWVYQNIIKKSGKGKAPSKDSKLFIPSREGYKGDIIPSEDTIFVFGSNPEGRHGAGAARVAKDKFGAQYGVGEGLTGNAYALPTKDLRVKENKGLRSISKESIIESIKTLYKVATENPNKQFKVAFRNKLDETTLNGYTGEEMIDMFLSAGPIPSNIIFSEEWLNTGKFNLSKQEIEDFSYEKGYLPLWQEWAKQNPELIEELRKATVGKTLTDKFASTRVSQARALADILNSSQYSEKLIQETTEKESTSAVFTYTDPLGNAIESLLGIDSIMYRDEVEELAHKVCIKISDTLTKIQNDPSIVEVITNGRVKGTPEMSRMTRNKLLQTIGVNDIINYIKELTFGSGNDAIADDMFEMADLLYNNFNTLVSFGMSTFAATEGFSFSLSENTVTVTEDNSSIEDVDEAELSENEGSRQEAWLVESVTKSVIDRMAQDVKAELQRCKVLDENGNEVVDRWGLSDNIPLQQATQTILTVTRGSFTLSDMIAKMEKGVKTYPWLQLLLPKLKDKSGQYSSFQSQFYNAMQSHFQLYSVVVNENGKIATKPVNKDTALTEAKRSIIALYNIRQHPLFDSKGAVNKSSLETLKTNLEQLKNKDIEDKLPIVQEVLTILGYDNTDSDFLASIVNDDVVKEISNSLHYIIKGLESHKDDKIITWKPFSADPKDKGIINNISKVIKPFTDVTIDATQSSFHADGKMYQSNKIPSYLTKLFLKFGELSNTVQSATELTPYYKFLQEEYGCTEWFRDSSEDLGVEVNLEMQKGWRLPWLQMLASDPKAREIFAHKVDISFDKKGYMKSSTGKYMNELEYALMALGEYFSETTSENNLADKVPAWFRVPMQSNKPSADFIRFYSYRGQNYKDAIVKDLLEIFNQELSRMQTCTMRKKEIAKDKSIEISSFDKNGTKFCFLDFLEEKRKDSDFGKLVEKKINGEEVNEAELLSQAELLIRESMEQRVAEMLTEFEANGIVQQASKVKGIDTSNIKEGIENFLWNDFLASINILELTITDVANYKNAEDLQKRLAQIHAPGNRPNIEAIDLEGNKVTDGTYRTIILEDFEGFKSNVVENLRYVFDLELAKLSDDNPNKAAAKATYDRIIEQFEKEVNVTDALGYSCPASYRKKALMFGRWSKRHEAIYQKLLKGEFTLTDIEEAFGPLKPFVYSNTTRSSYAENAPIKNLKVGVLYKNSEYMLVMADALIRRISNGRPNLLQAIFDVMKNSYEKDATKGIDTIQFKSSMKTGISGVLSLNDLVDDPDGYNKAVKRLEDAIYDKNGKDGYNAKHVHASPFEDYCIQQEVPPHFKNHHQAHGSQTRAITPSDLDPNAKYKVKINDLEYLEYTAQELIEEYESLIYENIKDSYTDLYRELEWNKDNQYTEEGKANLKRHLSEILKRELLSSQRHSLDLFYACTLKDGDFRVPLGDAVQSNKVEQLINSIIKNRINKQEIAGGPVVQASSFGLSKQLNMVFKDSNGDPLKTLKEFGGTEELYKQYVKDNQGSFSHMEVYAPIYDERLLEFLNADGTIDIKAIEKLNPELLDLVSYRIPTEDKYSIIPCKIVGFVPREAGEVIMMPEEVTLLTGSDRKISLFLPV